LPFFPAFSERCIYSWEGKCSLIVALGVFFPMYLDTLRGVCTLGPQLIDNKAVSTA
jgi:ABC-type nitrate/sulfonate/bicarbonate transport system permease component